MAKVNIPENFNLPVYEECEHWSAIEWLNAIEMRDLCHSILNGITTYRFTVENVFIFLDNSWNCGISNRQQDSHMLSQQSVEPLDLTHAAFIYDEINRVLNGKNDNFLTKEEALKLINGSLFTIDDDSEKEDFDKISNRSYDLVTLESLSRNNIDETGDKLVCAHAKINLSAPDSILIEDFKRYIQEQRQRLNWWSSKKPFSKKDFLEWHRFKLLPYIDLELWALASNVNFSYAVLAKALFPREYENAVVDGDKIRRTVKIKAKELLSYKTLNALRSQSYITKSVTH